MKKILYFLVPVLLAVGASFLIWGCDDKSDVLDTPDLKFLSVDISPNTRYSKQDMEVVMEAFKRLETQVVFRNGQYRLNKIDASGLCMSKDLYALLLKSMERTNEYIKSKKVVEIRRNVLRIVGNNDPISAVRLKGFGENVLPKDSNGYDLRLYGFDIYLSHATMVSYQTGVDTVFNLLLSTGAFDNTIISTVLKYISNFNDLMNRTCTNGIVMMCIWYFGFSDAWCQ